MTDWVYFLTLEFIIMDDREYEILKFLSDKTKGVILMDFPNSIISEYPKNQGEDRIDLQFSRVLVATKKWLYIHDRPPNGFLISDFGREALKREEDVRSKQNEKKDLELQKLRSENLKLTNELIDYEKIKQQRNILFFISVALFLTAIVTVILKLKESP